ncbi:M50 family metallopeptidase [Kocuria sp. cx-116]|uniref:M50 family metallopeptidase n=1 Tax=Kocuria sp. cx-116 TaxID=2771378 RepID=UPI001CC26D8B|nr:M50 family metallopeptidase [Kocuria sp. cx-116]
MAVLNDSPAPAPAPAPENGRAESTAVVTWFLTTPHQLKLHVERTHGLDDRDLLYDPARGKYLALSGSAGALISHFDGTRTGTDVLAQLRQEPTRAQTERVARLFHDIRQNGFLTEPPLNERGREVTARFARREHMFRFPMVRNVGRFLEPVTSPWLSVPPLALVIGWLLLAATGVGFGIAGLTSTEVRSMPTNLWVVPLVMAAQIAAHELAHAMVCQYLRVPAREAGVALMLYFLPVGYVDRTDSYRVRSRSGRIMIAMAGPLSDQVWFGAAGVLALTAPDPVAHMAVVVMVCQILLTVMNFNPLTPSDGYHAVTAALGIINMRGNALLYAVHLVLHTPLPTNFDAKGPTERAWLLVYAVGCLGFVVIALLSIVRAAGTYLAVFL